MTTPFHSVRTLAFRPRPSCAFRPNTVTGVKRRTFADDNAKHNALPQAQEGQTGPNMQQAEHVSEEAAKMSQIMGTGSGPDIEGQGTPVQDILKEDEEARKHAPQVMKDSLKNPQSAHNAKPSTRPFSTLARRPAPAAMTPDAFDAAELDPSMIPTELQRAAYTATSESQAPESSIIPAEKLGHKFPLPTLPLPPNSHKDHRHHPVVHQVTNLLMRDGKKAAAQRNMAVILSTLRTAPPPTYSAARPLLPGCPPASHLPLHPVLYLTLAIDSVAPILRIRSQRGAAGGGVALQIPVPLGLRQRRRQAFEWILDAASKRKSRGSGNDMFAQKVAEELVAVVEGRSGVWEKRAAVHRLATTARSNLTYGRGGRR
ncbi:hypothetical protein LTR36_002551 [Oleoguttula mirabilis]|uniref:Small ribosomal subunit protein uS7m n=1 Tax=Oleoguttula mirabilis TaxID=1507867 RepID=A0AAV9JKI2_9PEZI|nr:hypothetical protein LTR36_002551 [Oleoguttula mirabilis]